MGASWVMRRSWSACPQVALASAEVIAKRKAAGAHRAVGRRLAAESTSPQRVARLKPSDGALVSVGHMNRLKAGYRDQHPPSLIAPYVRLR